MCLALIIETRSLMNTVRNVSLVAVVGLGIVWFLKAKQFKQTEAYATWKEFKKSTKKA